MKNVHLDGSQPIGEIVRSSITSWVAEGWPNEGVDGLPEVLSPGFGSFLKVPTVEGLEVMAVVYNLITGPQDDNHRPAVLRLSREQLKLEQPHIFALLRTEIHAVTVGYFAGGHTFQHLPPKPPQVHDFVYLAQPAEIQAVTNGLDFLRLVSTVSAVPGDELLAAAVRAAFQAHDCDHAFLIGAGQALSHLYREDYDRLISILRKIKPEAIGV